MYSRYVAMYSWYACIHVFRYNIMQTAQCMKRIMYSDLKYNVV